MNKIFFTGVVEGRKDPQRLDRVQVRMFGVHTESLDDVPTESLPWALCLNESGIVSGIGKSGATYQQGTHVFGIFIDGESKQMPLILGAFPGVPFDQSPFAGKEQIVDSEMSLNSVNTDLEVVEVEVIDEVGKPVDTSATTGTSKDKAASNDVSTKNKADSRTALKDALGKRESNNNYKATNQFGYTGKYQMGASYLGDRGYMKKGVTQSKANMENPDNWTGKDGINSQEDFKNNPQVQEKAMDAGLDANEKSLTRMGVIDGNTTEQEKSGYLATSHLLGTGGARDMKNGVVKKDGNGVTGNSYYDLGYKAVAGKSPTVNPDKTSKDNPSREPSTDDNVGKTIATRKDDIGLNKTDLTAGAVAAVATSNLGFIDPDLVFPKYLNEQDTNRLARNQNIGKTIVPIKEGLEDKNVPKANGKGTWNQSPTPYNAKYPFNSVLETESGHVIEIDDTPNNERIHHYHKTGTFTEVDRNGTLVRRIVGDAYEIWDRNGYIHIKGTCNITVDGDANILVKNDCDLEIDGKLTANVGGDSNWSIGGNASWTVAGDVSWNIAGNSDTTITKDSKITVTGDLHTKVDGNINTVTAKDFNSTIEGDSKTKVTKDLTIDIGGNENENVGGIYAVNIAGAYGVTTGGIESHVNGAVHSISAGTVMASMIPIVGTTPAPTPVIVSPEDAKKSEAKQAKKPPTAGGAPAFGDLTLEPRNFEELSDFETEELTAEEAADRQNELSKAGLVDVAPEPGQVDDTKTEKYVPKKVEETPVTCDTFVSGKININDFISPNFRLKDLTKGANIPKEQAGLKDVQIACNLKALANNVLEKIKQKYPDMIITSGLRPFSGNKNSQHPRGEAADLQFTAHKSEDYAAIAKDIGGTCAFGQLILEYRTNKRSGNGSPTTWIHVSFSGGGNKNEVFTMNNDQRVGKYGELKVIK